MSETNYIMMAYAYGIALALAALILVLLVKIPVIGIFIPLVSLLFKLVAPKELGNYYSLLGQAQEKNPEALRQVRILAALEDETAKDFLKRLFTGRDSRIRRINDQDSNY